MLWAEDNGQHVADCKQVVPIAPTVVPGAADAEAITISTDHVHMAKFASREDSGYEKISAHLHLMTKDASNTIKLRWEQESRIEKGMN